MRSLLANALLWTATALVANLSGATAADDAVVRVLTIGYPDEDSLDPVTGAPVPGIGQLKTAFEKTNPSIRLDIVNIPWGSGATGYAPKTEAMMKADEACLYEMPAAASYGRRGFLVNLDTMIAKDKAFENVWGSQLDFARLLGAR